MKPICYLIILLLTACTGKLQVNSRSTASNTTITTLTASIQSPASDTVVGNVNFNIYPVTFSTPDGGIASSFSASNLPSGLSINTTTGTISGRPTSVGTFSVTISANSSVSNNSYSKTLTFKIFNELANDRFDSGSTIGLRINGTSGYSSGWNIYGALLTGDNTDQTTSTTMESSGLLSGLNIYKVSGDSTSCVGAGPSVDNLSLYCGGYGGNGQMGNGTNINNNASPILFDITSISSSAKLRQFTVGYGAVCAIYENNSSRYLVVAGYNAHGELGNGTTTNINTATQITIPNSEIPKQVNCGYEFMSVLTESGNVYSSGDNSNGQLGNGTTTGSYTLTQTSLSSVLNTGEYPVKLIKSQGHSAGVITNQNRLLVWGKGGNGQLGINSYTDQTTPIEIDTSGALSGLTIKDAVMGYNHTVVLTTDGSTYGFGENVGQLCTGNTTSYPVATSMDTSGLLSGRTVLKIAAGFTETILYLDNNTLVGCGQNAYGQLGVGDSSQHTSPTLMMSSITFPN